MKKSRKFWFDFVFIAYLLFLVSTLFLRHGRHVDMSIASLKERLLFQANFKPFKTVGNYIIALKHGMISREIVINNIFGNLVLFLPMGIMFPQFNVYFRRWYISLTLIFLIILSVEILQLLSGLGSFDVDDLILNFIGAMIGYMIFSKFENKTK